MQIFFFLKGKFRKRMLWWWKEGVGSPCLPRTMAFPAGVSQPHCVPSVPSHGDPVVSSELLVWLVEPAGSSRSLLLCTLQGRGACVLLEVMLISTLAAEVFASRRQGEKLNMKSCRVDRSETE